MPIKGRVVSVHNGVAEVCIIREAGTCGTCATCPKKIVMQGVIKVASIKGVRPGKCVILSTNATWFRKHWIILTVTAFICGILIAEGISALMPLATFEERYVILGGIVFSMIVLFISLLKKPRYPLKIERTEEGL